LSAQNESHDDYDNITNKEAKEDPKAVKAMDELKKEQRDSEQLDVNPDQVLEEKEKRQPQSIEEE
jgi:hypothetical protein